MKRVFLALRVPDTIKEEYESFITPLPSFLDRFEKTEKLHITLAFFGDVHDEAIENIQEIMKSACYTRSPFSLQLNPTLGAFPSLETPHVWWLPVMDKSGELTKLYTDLSNAIHTEKLFIRDYEFLPHITIYRRPPQDRSTQSLIEARITKSFSALTWDVADIVLYESHLTVDGSSYTILHYENFRH